MISLKLWHALNHPPAMHPLFWLTVRRSLIVSHLNPTAGDWSWVDRLSIAYLLVFAGAMLLVNVLGANSQSGLVTLMMFLLALPIIVPIAILLRSTLLSGSIYGLIWAMDISQFVARERQNGTHDLLCLLPPGGLAADWAICTGCLYRNQAFNQIIELRRVMLRIIFMFSAVIFLGSMGKFSLSEAILFAIDIAALLVALRVDFTHSIILSGLVGMIAPLYSYNRTEAGLWAAGGFITIQLSVYAVTALAWLVIVPRAFEILGFRGWLVTAAIPIFILLIFTVVREGIITGLWRWLLAQTNTDSDDLGRVFTFIP
jgi:hypothetical protein